MRKPARLGIAAMVGAAWGIQAWSAACPQDCDEADKVDGCCPQATTPARPAQPAPARPAASPTPKPRPTPTIPRIEELGGVRMAWIPPGNFLMGAAASDGEAEEDEKPQHRVEINAGFWLMETEVTQALWQDLMGTNPAASRKQYQVGQSQGTCKEIGGVSLVGADYPVMCVTWCEAVLFANALSRREGLAPAYTVPAGFVARMDAATCEAMAGKVVGNQATEGYRLPTEAEWEYAAREGEKGSRYAGTNDPSSACQYGNVFTPSAKAKFGWEWESFSCEDDHLALAPVGAFRANGWGLKDMTGNVWEWVFDAYTAYSDPGFSYGGFRVLRGGSWEVNLHGARAADRGSRSPGDRVIIAGFRLARSAAAPPPWR